MVAGVDAGVRRAQPCRHPASLFCLFQLLVVMTAAGAAVAVALVAQDNELEPPVTLVPHPRCGARLHV